MFGLAWLLLQASTPASAASSSSSGPPESAPAPARGKTKDSEPRWDLPAGQEAMILGLLGPHAWQANPLPGGFRLDSARVEGGEVRFRFHRDAGSFVLLLSHPSVRAPGRSKSFAIDLLPAEPRLVAAERARLRSYLTALIRARDQGDVFWWRTLPTLQMRERRVRSWGATRVVQGLLILCLLLLGLQVFGHRRRLRRLLAVDGMWLLGCSLLGLGLRLYSGLRSPVWINGHGNSLLNQMLLEPHRMQGWQQRGNGFFAVHELAMTLFGSTVDTIMGVQLCLSVITIGLVYAVARIWTRDRQAARWAAVIVAVLPVAVFYGLSEARMVLGSVCLLVTLTLLGLALPARQRGLALYGTVFWALLTAQCYPTLMGTPLLLLLLLLGVARGRALLRRPGTWLAVGLGLVGFAWPAWRILTLLMAPGEGVYSASYFSSVSWRPGGTFFWVWSFESSANVYFNLAFTPLTFGLLAFGALAAALLRRQPPRLLLLCALWLCMTLIVITGAVGGRLASARIHLAALPFAAVLSGVGLSALLVAARGGRRWPRWGAPGLGLLVVGLSLLLWPGLLGRRFSPQLEQQVFSRGVHKLPPGCRLVVPREVKSRTFRLPLYLLKHGPRLEALYVDPTVPLRPPTSADACRAYFRPAGCFDRSNYGQRPTRSTASGLIEECARFEARMVLEPLYLREIPARPDYAQQYTRPTLQVGFFRVRGYRDP